MITITEALAEIKTVNKRLASKREAMKAYIYRQDGVKDPLEKDGGSENFIRQERQACSDLVTRIITLRQGIRVANDTNVITIGKTTRTIADWLTWSRECASGEQVFLSGMRMTLLAARQQAQKVGAQVVPPGGTASIPQDVMVNVDERQLQKEIEELEEIVSTLDGQLSLKNATVTLPA